MKYHLQAPVTSLNGQFEDGDSQSQTQPLEQPVPVRDPPRPSNKPQGQSVNQFQDDNAVCGIPVAGFTQSLVIGGQAAGHGEWLNFDTSESNYIFIILSYFRPWLVAFYRSQNGNLEFICGGSLISSTFTVTVFSIIFCNLSTMFNNTKALRPHIAYKIRVKRKHYKLRTHCCSLVNII